MTPLLVALAVVAGGHVLVAAALAWVVRRAPVEPASPAEAGLPDVVVIVAARDEETTLARCLDALLAQDYPAERLTLVVADDHSVDRTAALVRGYARQHARRTVAAGILPDDTTPVPEIRLVRVPDPVGDLRGKAQALHAAIEATTAPVILVTDADCAPPPSWVRAKVARLASDPRAGIVCGMSRIAPRASRPFDHAQALDWVLLVGATGALVEAGVPATGMGNNMALRRAAYEATGGYPALPFSVTEDHTLVHAVTSAAHPDGGRWRVRFPLDVASTVWTLPAEGLAHAYAQRRRWARGGLGGGVPVWGTYVALHATRLVPLAALAVAPAWALLAVAAIAAGNALLVSAVVARTGAAPVRLADRLRMEAFQWLYLLTLPTVLLLRPGIEWKGRRHGARAPRPRPRRR